MQKPSLGRIVIADVPTDINNGADCAPAVITKAWEHPHRGWLVNLRILLDSAEPPLWRTAVPLYEERPRVVGEAHKAAWWPPRV
jgi:hypothetical protein